MTQDNRLEIRNKKFSVHQDSGCFFIRAPEKVTYEHILCVEGDRRVLIDAFDEFVACDVFEHYVLCRDINYLSNQTVGPYTRDQILNKEIQFVYRNVTDSGTLIIESGDETATVTTSVTSDSDGKQFTFGESGNTITFRERETKNIVIGKRVITVTFISFDAAVFTIDQIKSFGFPEEAIAGLDDISGEITYEQLVPESQLSALIEDIMGETTFENPVNLRMPEAVVEDIGGEVVYVDPYISLQPPQDLEVCPVVDMPTPTPTPTVLPATCDDATLALSPYTGVTTQDQLVVADVSCGGHRVESSGAAGVDSTVLHLGQPTIKTGSMSTGDGHVTYHDPPSHIFKTTQDFTFETWLMFENVTQEHRAFAFSHATRNRTNITYFHRGDITNSRDGESGSGRWWSLQINDGSGSTSASNVWRIALYWFTPVPMINNTWHHVVLTRHDNDQWAMYMDGRLCHMQREHPSIPGTTYGALDGVTTYDHATGTMYNNNSQNVSTTAHYHDYRFIERALYTREFDTSNVTENIMCVTDAQSTTCADVVLHLQSDTTDETASITDTSVNNHTITKHGDTHHETDDAYLGSSAITLDGSGDYLEIGTSGSEYKWLHDGTTDYTIECWVKIKGWVTDESAQNRATFISTGGTTAQSGIWLWANSSQFNFRVTQSSSGNVTSSVDANINPQLDTWYHLVASYDGDKYRLYVDGKLHGESAGSHTNSSSNSYTTLNIGRVHYPGPNNSYFNGAIQDIRISKRVVYTGDCFVTPTQLHPVLTTAPDEPTCADVVLHLQSDTTDETSDIVDTSVNNHTITKHGDTHHETDVKLFGDSSLDFDGSGDYITIGDTSTFKWLHDGTTDYTVECWVRFRQFDPNGSKVIFATGGCGQHVGIRVQVGGDPGTFNFNIARGTTGYHRTGVSNKAAQLNTWHHVAFVYKQQEGYLYVDGELVCDSINDGIGGSNRNAPSSANSFQALSIGRVWCNTEKFTNFNVQDFRISKKAIYTGDCVVTPTELHVPCATFTNTMVHLQPLTNEPIVDKSRVQNNVIVHGSVQADSTHQLFNENTMYFDKQAGNYIEVQEEQPDQLQLTADKNYTIETWMYLDASTSSGTIICRHKTYTGVGNGMQDGDYMMFYSSSVGLRVLANGARYTVADQHVNKDTWQHVAVVNSSGVVTIYMDGIATAHTQTAAAGTWYDNGHGASLLVGSNDGASESYMWKGALQDLRVSDQAIYTSDFTPNTDWIPADLNIPTLTPTPTPTPTPTVPLEIPVHDVGAETVFTDEPADGVVKIPDTGVETVFVELPGASAVKVPDIGTEIVLSEFDGPLDLLIGEYHAEIIVDQTVPTDTNVGEIHMNVVMDQLNTQTATNLGDTHVEIIVEES